MNKHVVIRFGAVLAILVGVVFALADEIVSTTGFDKWEKDMKAFEKQDATNPPPKGGVLFIGSSSIRKWTSVAEDFPEHKVINRGFGGSEMADVIHFADRIIFPYEPSMIFLYEGDNDMGHGRTADEILLHFKAFVEKVHAKLPETHIAFIAIKPSIKRRSLMEDMWEANLMIKGFCASSPRLHFMDVFQPMLDEEGEPAPKWFVSDGLHMNAEGYALWTEIGMPLIKHAGESAKK